MSVKKLLLLTSWHLLFLLLGSGLFILFSQTGLFKNLTVFFYRGIALLTLASFLTGLILLFLIKVQTKKLLTYRDLVISITLIFCLNLVFFTHLPVTADRSISVFMLGLMNKNSEKGLTKQQISKIFIEKYVYEGGAIRKRLEEQIASGNFEETESRYKISNQGKLVIKLYKIVANLFKINLKNISP